MSDFYGMARDAGYYGDEAEHMAHVLEQEAHDLVQQQREQYLHEQERVAQRIADAEKKAGLLWTPNDSRVKGQIITLLADGESAPKIKDQRGAMRDRKVRPAYLTIDSSHMLASYKTLLLDDEVALIDKSEFNRLHDDTFGTDVARIGVVPGRVWKARVDDSWTLKFLVAIEGNDHECYVVTRRLLLIGSREFYEWLDPDLWKD